MSTAPSNEDNPPTSGKVISSIVINDNCDFPDHAKNTLKFIEFYFQRQQLTDVTLVAGEKCIDAHRLILSASSDYFPAMFTSQLRESSQKKILLKGIDGDALEAIVQYSYTGCIELREENIEKLFVTARFLQVNPVVEACSCFLIKQLDPSNCLTIRKFADTQGYDNLSSAANAHALDNFVEVAKNPEFLLLSADELTEFLKSEDVNVPSEETIFYALRTWLEHDSTNRMKHASTLLSYVRLPLFTPRFIFHYIQTDELFRDQTAVQALASEVLAYLVLQERPKSLQSGYTRPRKSAEDVLLALGQKYDGQELYSSIDAYFLKANIWKNLMKITNRGIRFGAVLFEKELFVVGGVFDETPTNTVQSFDFSSCLWKDMPPMDTSRNGVGVAVLEGLLYAVGGYDNSTSLNTVERWNPNSKKWSYVSPMLMERCDAGVAVVNNKLYVVGGWDCHHELNTVECYDPHRNEWTSCSPMSEARDRVGLGVLDGYIYAIGGPSTSTPTSSVERYDAKTDTWTTIAPMSVARGNVGVGVIGDRLFAVGGYNYDGGDDVTQVEAYDPALDEWQEVAPIRVPSQGPCVVVNRSTFELWRNQFENNSIP